MKTLLIPFLLLAFVIPTPSQSASFDSWKKSYAKRASKRGLPYQFVMGILKDIEVNQKVLDKQSNQVLLSGTVDYEKFMKRWLRDSPSRAERGVKLLKENKELLEKIEKEYKVEKEVIVSLWGVETLYGEVLGDYNVIESLATLSYAGRRKKFFERQLNAALRLVKKGHIEVENFKGSWAGATGHCQFMPSNIPPYAVDYDGDGKVDIWNTKADIFASIANYLRKVGWKKGSSIGSMALNTKNIETSLNKYRSSHQYNKLGFRNLDGERIQSENWKRRKAATIPLKNSPVILRGGNYDVITKWNRSSLFVAFNILLVDSFKQANI